MKNGSWDDKRNTHVTVVRLFRLLEEILSSAITVETSPACRTVDPWVLWTPPQIFDPGIQVAAPTVGAPIEMINAFDPLRLTSHLRRIGRFHHAIAMKAYRDQSTKLANKDHVPLGIWRTGFHVTQHGSPELGYLNHTFFPLVMTVCFGVEYGPIYT